MPSNRINSLANYKNKKLNLLANSRDMLFKTFWKCSGETKGKKKNEYVFEIKSAVYWGDSDCP